MSHPQCVVVVAVTATQGNVGRWRCLRRWWFCTILCAEKCSALARGLCNKGWPSKITLGIECKPAFPSWQCFWVPNPTRPDFLRMNIFVRFLSCIQEGQCATGVSKWRLFVLGWLFCPFTSLPNAAAAISCLPTQPWESQWIIVSLLLLWIYERNYWALLWGVVSWKK